MSKFKMYQLGRDSSCNKRRNFGYQVNDTKGETYYKAVAVLQATKSILKGKSVEEIEQDLIKAFEDIPYQEQQRRLLINDSMKQIKRYVEWESRPLIEAISADISLYGKMEVEVTPSFIIAEAVPVYEMKTQEVINKKGKKTTKKVPIQVADGYIEIIKLKAGKPVKIQDAKDSLELFSLLMYGRKFYKQGKLQIRASYYHLTRSDDSYGDKPSFREFDESQIRSLIEVYEGKPNETDEKFEPMVEDFVNGHEEADCNPDDCAKCILYTVCKGYTDAPVSSDREFSTSVGDIRLNEQQQIAVNY